ncbi:MAG: hypothetical protein Q4B82_05460 [Alysiella sp.]|uniref:hypothetical protein n=1 Tax=Alysiella sp. TaxID=1872483 RepID=UPI0026DA7599|nr:hypothetical protein [Alysiella sp.]MDO4434012.1 hypothetical protein [Alysiella sp.]
MIISTTILLTLLAFLLSCLLIIRRLLAKQERKLGYPKANEDFDDVKLLVLLQQDIFALRCYRRIYPKATLAEAKYMINKLHTQAQEQAKNIVSNPAQSTKP